MPIDEFQQRWACYSCITGHRAQTCAHFDRWMIAVKGPGRPPNTCPHPNPDLCDCAGQRMSLLVAIPLNHTCPCDREKAAKGIHSCRQGRQFYMTKVDGEYPAKVQPQVSEELKLQHHLVSEDVKYSSCSPPAILGLVSGSAIPQQSTPPSSIPPLAYSSQSPETHFSPRMVLNEPTNPYPDTPGYQSVSPGGFPSPAAVDPFTFHSPQSSYRNPGGQPPAPIVSNNLARYPAHRGDNLNSTGPVSVDHVCTCGQDCECVACPVHPYNPVMRQTVQSATDVITQPPQPSVFNASDPAAWRNSPFGASIHSTGNLESNPSANMGTSGAWMLSSPGQLPPSYGDNQFNPSQPFDPTSSAFGDLDPTLISIPPGGFVGMPDSSNYDFFQYDTSIQGFTGNLSSFSARPYNHENANDSDAETHDHIHQ